MTSNKDEFADLLAQIMSMETPFLKLKVRVPWGQMGSNEAFLIGETFESELPQLFRLYQTPANQNQFVNDNGIMLFGEEVASFKYGDVIQVRIQVVDYITDGMYILFKFINSGNLFALNKENWKSIVEL